MVTPGVVTSDMVEEAVTGAPVQPLLVTLTVYVPGVNAGACRG